MPQEALGAIVGFGIFFTMWVVLPSILHKRHVEPEEERNPGD